MLRRLSIAIPLALLAGCIPSAPPAPQPAPPPTRPEPTPEPAPPPPPPASSDWRDWPLTPGDWRYAATAGGSSATFGANVMTLTCERGSRAVTLAVQGTGTRLTLRTSSTARTLAAQPATQPGMVTARLQGRDNLLDAMGFSRGRFVIEGAGPRPLVIPAWPEILRVAEDCRG